MTSTVFLIGGVFYTGAGFVFVTMAIGGCGALIGNNGA